MIRTIGQYEARCLAIALWSCGGALLVLALAGVLSYVRRLPRWPHR